MTSFIFSEHLDELLVDLKRLKDCSDLEMGDGDAARDFAQRWLALLSPSSDFARLVLDEMRPFARAGHALRMLRVARDVAERHGLVADAEFCGLVIEIVDEERKGFRVLP